ncbi:MAG: tripartite tricarboxylate transporter substrate binding protein [Burkholderiales bacterium]
MPGHLVKCLLAAAFVAAGAATAPTHAESYPGSKPITIVVPTAPGGGNDTMARLIGQELSKRMKVPVIVDNKPGGHGIIGSQFAARAKPDGHTILFGYIGTHGINPALFPKLPYNAVKDFAPITLVAAAPGVLVVNPSVPAKTVQELAALAKSKPGALNCASAGGGTAPHVSCEMFALQTGTQMTHVPYKGSAPAVTDTLAGHTQVMFPSLVAAQDYIKQDKLRGLAVTSKARSPLFPSLPTMAESGLPDFEVTQWYGFFAPAKTPKEVVDRLFKEFVAIMKEPDMVKKFAEQGADVVVSSSPEEFGKFVQADIAKWTDLVKKANIKPE